ncbi:MAG: HAMP domain-containing histidine kinase [Elusimicrobia bacterium]|nr:HAMP domain-containing histidine kinase [Elusimicrobiota bacterium]
MKKQILDNRNFPIISAIALLPIIAYLDFITGRKVSFSLFYLIPIVIITWNTDYLWGLIFSIVSAVLWFIIDKISGSFYSHYTVPYWNALVRFSFFIIISLSLSKIKELLEKERRISKLNSDMLSAVSHEFNNLLVGINLTAVLLEEDEGGNIKEDRLKLYKMHRQNYSAMREQIKIFLNKAKLESGKIKLDIQRVEIRTIINETVNLLLPMTFEKNINIIRDFPETILAVQCDSDLINLAISNLISNAIKYSPKNETIVISIRKVNENFVEISVNDHGIGIDPHDFEKIFTGFYRTDEGIKEATGFGIGLKLTKDIITLHNSKLNMESKKGKGSRFYFTLPIYK